MLILKNLQKVCQHLYDKKFVWKSAVKNYFEDIPTHDVLIGGAIAPNPVQLLTNGNLETFLNEAKKFMIISF